MFVLRETLGAPGMNLMTGAIWTQCGLEVAIPLGSGAFFEIQVTLN
jgi:hypothetical protein